MPHLIRSTPKMIEFALTWGGIVIAIAVGAPGDYHNHERHYRHLRGEHRSHSTHINHNIYHLAWDIAIATVNVNAGADT